MLGALFLVPFFVAKRTPEPICGYKVFVKRPGGVSEYCTNKYDILDVGATVYFMDVEKGMMPNYPPSKDVIIVNASGKQIYEGEINVQEESCNFWQEAKGLCE